MTGIPDPTREIFDAIKEEVAWVHTKWAIYKELFGTSDERLRLLTQCAYAFFLILSDVLKDDLFISLSRLTDNAGKKDRKNLSFEQLQRQVEKNGDRELSSRLRQTLDDLRGKSKVLVSHRNKRLAHRDLETVRVKTANLERISVQMVEEVLSLMADYMNSIQGHYYRSQEIYDGGISLYTGAEALIGVLKHGMHLRELRKGEKIPEDELCKGEWSDA